MGAACQSSSEGQPGELPTLFQLPTDAPAEALAALPTTTEPAAPTATVTPTSTPTLTPTETPEPTATPTQTPEPLAIPTLTPDPMTVMPTRPPLPEAFIFGQSVQGRDLRARRIGEGQRLIMLVGGIHGGAEINTVGLVEALQTHFEDNPGQVLPDITLLFVPQLNPDGVALGRVAAGRFNANGVDLNRNWACDWQAEAFFRDQPVGAGSGPFSEPETLAMAALINDLRPAVVLFYHSAADGVFAGNCGGDGVSAAMAEALGQATGYPYGQPFTNYAVTGTAPGWVDSLGIPAADVELSSATDIEFERNLRGVMALQCWLLGNPQTISVCR